MTATLAALPALLGVYGGLGFPWALVALPRQDWKDRGTLWALSFAFGPLLLTAWMFVLGTLGAASDTPLLRFDRILAGVGIMFLVGAALAWRKSRMPVTLPPESPPARLVFDEKLLIGLIAAALLVRLVSIAFWPFTAYDALWVFGYEGRLYTLLGTIPQSIGYYPQFMPLQYTFAQLAVGGLSDHSARAVILFTHLGSILAAYVLGRLTISRRVGLFAAALWALYPHVGEWARFGDLEIPVTFLFTLSAAFFLRAWLRPEQRRRYALIAGVCFGGAMWTKPTAGALIWGVLLLLAVELVRVRFDWRAWRPRFEVALIMGLACLPLGAIWYVRNGLLGHALIDFPTDFWLTQAARSGVDFGWPLLALLILGAYLYLGPIPQRPQLRGGLLGLGLILAGLLPSLLDPHRLGLLEWALLLAGAVVLWRTWRPLLRVEGKPLSPAAIAVGWALLLALPYFVTWFYSYSYHYRLSFAMVPLLSLPTAALLSAWLTPARLAKGLRPARWLYGAALVALALPGIFSTLYDGAEGWDWLWNGALPDDVAKYSSGNAALMWVVDGLQKWVEDHPDQQLVVAAPGIERLPFFFPAADIRVDEAPTRWEQLDGVTYFIDSSPEGRGAYAGIPLEDNQVLSGLALATEDEDEVTAERAILRRAWWKDDGYFTYTVYELHLDNRLHEPSIQARETKDVTFGGFVRFLGHDIGGDFFWPGRRLVLRLYWEVLAPPDRDYTIYIHLRDASGHTWVTWDGPISRTQDGRYYTSLVWEPGEYIVDWRQIRLPKDSLAPVGDGYQIVIGLYDAQTQTRVPVTLDGEPAGDGYAISEHIGLVADAPD